MSKATPMSASVKYATGGKEKKKKDLGMHAMLYESVYVASVALGANMNQCVQVGHVFLMHCVCQLYVESRCERKSISKLKLVVGYVSELVQNLSL